MNQPPFDVQDRRAFPWIADAIPLGGRFVCYGDKPRTLTCYESSDFSQVWIARVPEDAKGSIWGISAHDGVLFARTWSIISDHGTLTRFDTETGNIVWSRTIPNYDEKVPLVANGLAFVSSGNGLIAIDVRNGRRRLRVSQFLSRVQYSATRNELLGIDLHGNLAVFNATTGEFLQSLELAIPTPCVFMSHQGWLFIGDRERYLHVVDVDKWRIERSYNVTPYSHLIIDADTAWLQTLQDNFDGHRFGSLDLQTGELRWDVPLPFDAHRPVHSPHPLFLRRGLVWISDLDGPIPVYALACQTGELQAGLTMDFARKIEPSIRADDRVGRPFLLAGKVCVSVAKELWSLEIPPSQLTRRNGGTRL